jgi:peroxiredoxin
VVIGLDAGETSDPQPRARSFRDQHHLTYPIWLDTKKEAGKALGVLGFPTNLVIDREGTIRYLEPGFNPGGLDSALRGLMERQ